MEQIIKTYGLSKDEILGYSKFFEDILSSARKILSSISNLDSEYAELYDRLENVFAEINDIADNSNSILDNFEEPEYNIDQIDERLSLIKGLKNKYGDYKLGDLLHNLRLKTYLDRLTSATQMDHLFFKKLCKYNKPYVYKVLNISNIKNKGFEAYNSLLDKVKPYLSHIKRKQPLKLVTNDEPKENLEDINPIEDEFDIKNIKLIKKPIDNFIQYRHTAIPNVNRCDENEIKHCIYQILEDFQK